MSCHGTISPTYRCSGSSPAPTVPTSTPPPQTWLQLLGLTGSPTPLPEKYCGLSLEDATSRCSTTVPCPDGKSDNCPSSESCFPIPVPCSSVSSYTNAVSGDSGASVSPPPAPTSSIMSSFDNSASTPAPTNPSVGVVPANNTSFCGSSYNDALTNCYKNTPCPSGLMDDCPSGQGCFTIPECITPPPSTSSISTSVGDVVVAMDTPETPNMRPTTTPQPTWNFDFSIKASESSAGSCMMGVLMKSVVLGGVILGAFVL